MLMDHSRHQVVHSLIHKVHLMILTWDDGGKDDHDNVVLGHAF